MGKINKLEEKGEMAWCWSGRESYGKCNYFRKEGDSRFYYVETEFEQVGFVPLWPVESFVGMDRKDGNSEKVEVTHPLHSM